MSEPMPDPAPSWHRWLPQDTIDWLLVAIMLLSSIVLLCGFAFVLSFVGAALHA